MKHLKTAAALLLIILIFLPVPLRGDSEFEGRRMAAEEEEAAEISFHGWRFCCLVRKDAFDLLRAHLMISPFPRRLRIFLSRRRSFPVTVYAGRPRKLQRPEK